MPRHRHQDFIDFIATVERSVPPGKVIHAILDNYAAHKHPKVMAWLAAHPRWTFTSRRPRARCSRRRRLLLPAHPAKPKARRLPLRRRTRKNHRPLHRRNRQKPKALRLDSHSEGHQDKARREPSVKVGALALICCLCARAGFFRANTSLRPRTFSPPPTRTASHNGAPLHPSTISNRENKRNGAISRESHGSHAA